MSKQGSWSSWLRRIYSIHWIESNASGCDKFAQVSWGWMVTTPKLTFRCLAPVTEDHLTRSDPWDERYIYLTFTIQNQRNVGKYTSPMNAIVVDPGDSLCVGDLYYPSIHTYIWITIRQEIRILINHAVYNGMSLVGFDQISTIFVTVAFFAGKMRPLRLEQGSWQMGRGFFNHGRTT